MITAAEPILRVAGTSACLRVTLPHAIEDRLYFAQVREDSSLEVEALRPAPGGTIVVVSSGGCTALSLAAAGAGRVVAVDLNRSQNHLVELKLAAVRSLERATTLALLGATPTSARARAATYRTLRDALTPAARAYWDTHTDALGSGLLNAGVTERFIRAVVTALRVFVHPRARMDAMLSQPTLDAQREFFADRWNTRRWRAFFRVLLNRAVFRRAYDDAFFRHLEKPSFAEHFRGRADYSLTQLQVSDNYFLHHMLTGEYAGLTSALPGFLVPDTYQRLARGSDVVTLVDGAMTDCLRALPSRSIAGFALSNIAEWMTPRDVDAMFAEIARVAEPGARVCFRNFVGWTEVPERWRTVIVEDRAYGETLFARDRSVVQRRLAVCNVRMERAR